MSDLTAIEKRKLERALGMSGGYVLNFSNRTFAEFFLDCSGIDIYTARYDYHGDSKANHMRAFWEQEGNYLVGKALGLLFEEWDGFRSSSSLEEPPEECLRIVRRLQASAPVPEIGAVSPNIEDESFDTLARSVRDAISRNEPEAGLDRLHTFLVKYFRVLCSKRGIETGRDKPLHSLVGEYVRALKREDLIQSETTERILKSTISILEAFNRVRNEQSFAHDNEVLNHEESLLIFGHVTSSIRFVEALETRAKGKAHGADPGVPAEESVDDWETPF